MNKKILPFLTLLIAFTFNESFAQFSKPVSVGIGGGGTRLYGDLKEMPISYAGHVDLDALINPYISVGINAQTGKLLANDSYERDSRNKYVALNGNIKVRIGQFMGNTKNYSYYTLSDKSIQSYLSNIYIGAGVGFISNNVNAQRAYDNTGEVEAVYEGLDKSTELIVPLNIGIDFPIGQSLYGPTWAINLNYQHSISTGDNIDGYASRFSKSNDQYGYLSLGVKIALFNRR